MSQDAKLFSRGKVQELRAELQVSVTTKICNNNNNSRTLTENSRLNTER
jgi:hypothetical protein